MEQAEAVRFSIAARLGLQDTGAALGTDLPVPDDGSDVVVLLDNCEHLLDAVAIVANELLASNRRLRVLATSREPLRLPDEVVLRLGTLPVPGSADEPDAVSSPAVVLFTERATAARADFSVDEGTLPRVVEICRSLDGLPLALEIAGARVRSLGVADISRHLSKRLSLFSTDARGTPTRHRSLRAVVEWSYSLLEDHERELFDRLAVFPAGFDTEAAIDLGRSLGIGEEDVLRGLDGLVAKSLLATIDDPEGMRYRMLETLRTFGIERLEATGLLSLARDQHADHYVDVARALMKTGLSEWSERVTPLFWEFENMRAAIAWTTTTDSDCDRTFDLLSPLWYVGLQEKSREVLQLCDSALRRWPDATAHPAYSEVQATAAVSLLALDDLARARARAELAIEAASSPVGLAWAWAAVADTSYRRQDAEAALIELDRADAAAVAAAFEPLRCDLLATRTLVLAQCGRLGEAWTTTQKALQLATDQRNLYQHAWHTHMIGLLLMESDPAAAHSWLTTAFDEATRIRFPYGTGASMRGLGVAAARLGAHVEAADWFRRALEQFGRAGMRLEGRTSVAAIVPLLLQTGRRETAAAAVAHLEACGAVVERLSAPGFDAARQALQPDLASGGLAARGRALDTPQVLSLLTAELRDIANATTASAQEEPRSSQPAQTGGSSSGLVAQLVRAGSLWRATYDGTTVHLPMLKGLADLAVLLERPDREVAALDLATPGAARTGAARTGAARTGAGDEVLSLAAPADLGEQVDAQARAAYAARLRELQQELEDADATGDVERGARAQQEFEALTEHLAAAYGLRGARRAGDPAERARAAVTARIRAALERIREVHPALGRHLDRSVRTGRFCSYHPDEPVTWTVTR